MPDQTQIKTYRNPSLSTDIIISLIDHVIQPNIVLIERRNPPFGWALPGGFVDYGESVEHAAVREALEETGLEVTLNGLLYVYSDPARDPRQHVASVVFFGQASGKPLAGDDAKSIQIVPIRQALSMQLVCDHGVVLKDYWQYLSFGVHPKPKQG